MSIMENLEVADNLDLNATEMTDMIANNTDDFIAGMESIEENESLQVQLKNAVKTMFEGLKLHEKLKKGKTFEDFLDEVANGKIKVTRRGTDLILKSDSLKASVNSNETKSLMILPLLYRDIQQVINGNESAIGRVEGLFKALFQQGNLSQHQDLHRRLLKAKIALAILENGGSRKTVASLFTEKDTVTPAEYFANAPIFIGNATPKELRNAINSYEDRLKALE